MKEFMLYIRNDGSELPAETEQDFLKQCEIYIERLKADRKLIGAQPLANEGIMISGTGGEWRQADYHDSKDSNAGYYHIRAKNLDEAIAIAKQNPEFAYRKTARIEVRPIKTDEESTEYMYPSEAATNR